MNEWNDECVSDWVKGWKKERMNEWMNEYEEIIK